jgi:FkbH-like protein
VLWNNFPLPAQPTLGILDAQSEISQAQTVLRLNEEIRRLALQVPDTYVVDFMSLLARLGSTQGLDERQWQASRVPLGRQALVPAGQLYGRFARALRGRSRKCLVLDCDNTLWGGVVAEDGAAHLALGKDSTPGRYFTAFQQQILDFHDRGVLLALCSKNNEADVLAVLRDHPEMLIREHHLATWQINWDDKVTNLRRIAADLNIGLDSLVFVDDSPFECGLVRAQLPEVATIELPGDPSAFVAHLLDGGHFDALTLSAEDRARTRMYREEGARRKLRKGAGTLEEYLHSLDLVAEIDLIDEGLVPRVSQLTQKTNQFNLTTRRYAEGEIRALANSASHAVLALKLGDRIADLGTVGVAILAFHGVEAEIDTLLLSCRALGRGAEDALLAAVLNLAQDRGCTWIRGRYVPTPKNQQVADFFARRGFREVAAREWQLPLRSEPYPPPAWIEVHQAAGARGIRHAG